MPPSPGYYGGVPPGYGRPNFPSFSPSPGTRQIDQDSLRYLLWASVLLLSNAAVSLTLFLSSSSIYAEQVTTSGDTIVFTNLFFVVAAISGALTFVEVFLLRRAFHRLEPADPRFATPSKLSLLLLAGFVLVLVALVPLLLGVQAISGCLASSSNSTLSGGCGGIGDFLLGALLLLAGGIVALIGYIGCILGVWRFGSRYQNDLFKVGAILLIIPAINVVGAILILIAAYTTRNRLGVRPGSGFSIQ